VPALTEPQPGRTTFRVKPGTNAASRRAWGLLFAVVLVASQASAWFHAVAIAHVACAEHGEAMHGGVMPHVDVDVDARAPREDDGSSLAADLDTVAGHDHCAPAALLRWRDVALTAPSALVSVDIASGSVPFAPSHVGLAATVVYLIAPKTSPPDRSV
jgi:hypothetical protein